MYTYIYIYLKQQRRETLTYNLSYETSDFSSAYNNFNCPLIRFQKQIKLEDLVEFHEYKNASEIESERFDIALCNDVFYVNACAYVSTRVEAVLWRGAFVAARKSHVLISVSLSSSSSSSSLPSSWRSSSVHGPADGVVTRSSSHAAQAICRKKHVRGNHYGGRCSRGLMIDVRISQESV